jgi:uncharacterized protein YeeX (DUF496 family)
MDNDQKSILFTECMDYLAGSCTFESLQHILSNHAADYTDNVPLIPEGIVEEFEVFLASHECTCCDICGW